MGRPVDGLTERGEDRVAELIEAQEEKIARLTELVVELQDPPELGLAALCLMARSSGLRLTI